MSKNTDPSPFSKSMAKFSIWAGDWKGGWCAQTHAGILDLFTFFCLLKTSILELGMVEHMKVRQNCHRMENHFFKFIHEIKKKSSVIFVCTAL